MSKLISFIIPAYNAANTLESCVKSVISTWTESNIEVLIVENGSTDATTALAEGLAQIYEDVRVLHSEKGVSAARNLGIQHATGEWLFFLDADDHMTQQACKALTEAASAKQAQLYMFSYQKGSGQVLLCEESKKLFTGEALTGCFVEMLENPTRCMAVWGKLFYRELVENQGLFFDPNLSMAEDSDFLIRYMINCSSVCWSKAVVYDYTVNVASAVHTYDGTKVKKYVDALRVTKAFIDTQPQVIRDAFVKYILMHFNLIMVHEVFHEGNPTDYAGKLQQMRSVGADPIFAEAFGRVRLSECTSARMLPIALYKKKQYRMCGRIYQMRVRQNAGKK